MTTTLSTLLFIVSTVALLPLLDNLVATERPITLLKAIVFPIVHHGIEHGADVLQAAGGELVVVLSVARGGGREHDEVATRSTRPALNRVIVRRTEVMADLVGEGELGDFGRNPAVVVDEGDDAGVEAALGGVVDSVHILGVGFVLFTDAPTSPTC